MTRRTASGLVATVLALVTVLSGCSSITGSVAAQVPTSGPIEQGEQVGVQREDQFIRVIAREPRPGMTPEQVERLREQHAVYILRSGRMCITGLRTTNVEQVAQAMAAVLA